jgi:hypothetical protein
VGFNGYPHSIVQSTELVKYEQHENSLGLILNTQLDVQGPILLRGVEWIYSWVESALSYSTTILYESSITTTDLTDLEHFLWSYDYKLSIFLFLCVVQDLQNLGSAVLFPYSDVWYNYIINASNNIIFNSEHPEFILFYNNALVEFLIPYISTIRFLFELENSNEGTLLIPFVVLDIIGKISLFGVFISFFMHWYNVSSNNNNLDSDFLVNSLSVEAEEEIASIDDTVILLIVIFFIFGWFFFLII